MKIPTKVKKWAEKQEEPAFALACWYMTTKGFKGELRRIIEETK